MGNQEPFPIRICYFSLGVAVRSGSSYLFAFVDEYSIWNAIDEFMISGQFIEDKSWLDISFEFPEDRSLIPGFRDKAQFNEVLVEVLRIAKGITGKMTEEGTATFGDFYVKGNNGNAVHYGFSIPIQRQSKE